MAKAKKPILDVRNLYVKIPPNGDRPYAVENVSFTVAPNEIVCIAGESGSGKSVTAQAVMGLLQYTELKPTQGEIWLDGDDLMKFSHKQMLTVQGVRVGMIFQEPMTALNPVQKIGAQIEEMFIIHTDLNAEQREEKVLSLLKSVNLPRPEQMMHMYPHELSGGQRQRVMIAIALALNPSLLIADEPTTALDVTTQATIIKLIKEIQQNFNIAVLFITHDFGVIADIADRIVVMKDGRVVEQGTTKDILENPKNPYTRMLIDAVPSLQPPKRESKLNNPIEFQVKDLMKSFGGKSFFRKERKVEVLHNINFDIHSSETVGLVGESGAGKTTLARCIMRLIEPDAGEINIFGYNVLAHNKEALRTLRQDVQFIFQDPYRSLNPRLTVARSIIEGPTNFGVSKKQALEEAAELMRVVGLSPDALYRYPHQFSGGQRQRICVARALALKPKILIADEPVSALDVSVQAQVLELFTDIRDQFGLAILFITHDLRVAAQVCERMLVIHDGYIVEQGNTYDIYNNPQHPYTKELLSAAPGSGKFR